MQLLKSDLIRWKSGSREGGAPPPDTGSDDHLQLEVNACHTHYVPLWRKGTYAPPLLRAEGTGSVPTVTTYGRLPDGRSVAVHAWNFHPYFYVKATQRMTAANAEHVRQKLHDYIEDELDAERRFPRKDYLTELAELEAEFESDARSFKNKKQASAPAGGDSAFWGSVGYGPSEDDYKPEREDPGPCVISVDLLDRIDATDSFGRKQQFFKVTLRTPNMIRQARDLFHESGGPAVSIGGRLLESRTFESNVVFENRFMIDRGIVGSGWARVNRKHMLQRPSYQRQTRCDLELDVDAQYLAGYDLKDEANKSIFSRPSQKRIVSYDLECSAPPGCFPKAELDDQIIQISAYHWVQSGEKRIKQTNIFVLGSCEPIRGAQVYCFETERALINGFGLFLQALDADIITGYNTSGFDDAYIYTRAERTGATAFLESGRHKEVALRAREVKQMSRNNGNSERTEVIHEGRVCYDMLPFLQQNKKFSSYALNNVARILLKDQKEDMDYEMITPLHCGTAADRRQVATYCIKDAVLPYRIAQKLLAFEQVIEFARVTGVQLAQIQGQGSSIKVMTAVLNVMKELDILMPYMPNQPKIEYEGALVAEPVPGFYTRPIAVLDFSALYPSLMIAHNISFDTYVSPEDVARIRAATERGEDYYGLRFEDLEKSPDICKNTHYFIKREKKVGVLTKVLEGLLGARKAAKKAMAKAGQAADEAKARLEALKTDPNATPEQLAEAELEVGEQKLLETVYNMRQLAIKVLANSVYGWTGLSTSIYFWQCADTTTAWGRDQITHTKHLIETKYTRANGYPGDAKCIYGDTDSVMVDFGVEIEGESLEPCEHCKSNPKGCDYCYAGKAYTQATLNAIWKVTEISTEAGEYCTGFYAKPNALEHENVYWPYLLLHMKKRYVGPFWELRPRKEPDESFPKSSPWRWFFKPLKPKYTKVRGLESVRRDHAQLSIKTQEAVINAIIYELDPDKGVQIVKDAIRRLRAGEVDLGDLVITNRLNARQNMDSSDYKKRYIVRHGGGERGREAYKEHCAERGVYTGKQPHAQLDIVMQQRTGKGYNLNERVPYVIVDKALGKKTSKHNKVYLKAEDPIYALKYDMRPDLEYYTRDLINCTANVLAPVYEAKLSERIAETLHDQPDQVERLVKQAQPKLTAYYKKHAVPPGAGDAGDPMDVEATPARPMAKAAPTPPSPPRTPKAPELGGQGRQRSIAAMFGIQTSKRPREDKQTKVRKKHPQKKAPEFGWRTKAFLGTGDHMLQIRTRREIAEDQEAEKGTLTDFTSRRFCCVGCEVPLQRGYLCEGCRGRVDGGTERVERFLRKYVELHTKSKACWKKCYECKIRGQEDTVGPEETQRALEELVVPEYGASAQLSGCAALNCENFFQRTAVERERDRLRTAAEALRGEFSELFI